MSIKYSIPAESTFQPVSAKKIQPSKLQENTGKPANTLPEIGKIYKIQHSRKGDFVGKLTKLSGEWATFEILSGEIHWASMENKLIQKLFGDEIVTVRDSLSYLVEIEDPKQEENAKTPDTNS